MIRDAIKALQETGPMNDSNMEQYIALLAGIEPPVNVEEARVIAELFPENDCCGVDWTLLHLMESAWPKLGEAGYLELIELCPSECWKHEMRRRLQGSPSE